MHLPAGGWVASMRPREIPAEAKRVPGATARGLLASMRPREIPAEAVTILPEDFDLSDYGPLQ